MTTTTHNCAAVRSPNQSDQSIEQSPVLALPRRIGHLILEYLSGQRGRDDSIVKIRIAVATVFAATLAGLAAGHATSYILPKFWPPLVGLAWGLMIANFDTMVTALIGSRIGTGRLMALAPRLPMVVLSSVVLVELLMLRVFQPEVTEFLAKQSHETAVQERRGVEERYVTATEANAARFTEDIARREKALGELQGQVADSENRRRQAGNRAVDAVRDRRRLYNLDGTFYFDSSYSRAAQAEEQRLGNEVEKLREQLNPEFKRNRDEIAQLRSEQSAEQLRIDQNRDANVKVLTSTSNPPGLLARVVAFEEICKRNRSAWWARVCLGLLLFAVEFLPTLAKLGERSHSALIREHLHVLLQEALKSDSLRNHLRLWLEASTHAYVQPYVQNMHAAMGVGEPVRADSEKTAQELEDDADSRIRRLLNNRGQTDQRKNSAQ